MVGGSIGVRALASAREMIRPLASGECHFREHDLSAGQLGVDRLPHGSDSTTAALTMCRRCGRLHLGARGSLEATSSIRPIDPIDEPQTGHRHSDFLMPEVLNRLRSFHTLPAEHETQSRRKPFASAGVWLKRYSSLR